MSYGPGTGGYYPPSSGGGGYPPPGGGGYPPPGGGPGFQSPPPAPASQGAAIGALIANVVGMCFCWALAIVGVVLAVISLSLGKSNPQSARTCALISWVLFGAGVLLGVVLLVFYGGMGFLGTY